MEGGQRLKDAKRRLDDELRTEVRAKRAYEAYRIPCDGRSRRRS